MLQLHRPHRAAAKEAAGWDPGPGMDRLVSRPAALRLGCVWTAKVQSAESIMLASCKTLANKQRLQRLGQAPPRGLEDSAVRLRIAPVRRLALASPLGDA